MVTSSCKSVRYLGVTILSNLTWSEVRVYRLNVQEGQTPPGSTPSQSLLSPPHIRKQIYQSAILPKLEYCSSVWDPHHQTEIDALEGVHKFASKVVSKVVTRQWKADSTSLRKSLNWPPYPNAGRYKSSRYAIAYSSPSYKNSFCPICQHLCP